MWNKQATNVNYYIPSATIQIQLQLVFIRHKYKPRLSTDWDRIYLSLSDITHRVSRYDYDKTTVHRIDDNL